MSSARRGSRSRWNASFDVMACSRPGISGTVGHEPVASRMCRAEKRRPPLARGPAEALGDLEVFAQVRGVGEELFRNAADVDAGAAEAAGFGDRHLRAVARADAARAHAPRAAADGEEVEVELHRA